MNIRLLNTSVNSITHLFTVHSPEILPQTLVLIAPPILNYHTMILPRAGKASALKSPLETSGHPLCLPTQGCQAVSFLTSFLLKGCFHDLLSFLLNKKSYINRRRETDIERETERDSSVLCFIPQRAKQTTPWPAPN